MGGGDDYRFMAIEDAMASLNQKVNIIGVVVEMGMPKRSKGTDCFCTVKIVDQSHRSSGISVNVFAENMEKLPHVESAGDIIQFSHVVMKTHGQEVYALFNKKFSSFAIFEGKYGEDFSPYQVSSNFCPRDQDKKFVKGLRKWLADSEIDKGMKEPLSLREIREGERVDLFCKILHICEVTKDEWMVFVWDGTDTPPVSIQTKLEDEMDNPLPLQLESLPLSRDILCTFPTVGTILRVIVDQGSEKLSLHLLKVGKWVRFLKIICEVHAGLWRGVLMPSTKLRYMPDEDLLVSQRQRFYDERLFSKWERMPLSSFPWPSRITETDYEHVPFVTLMDVLTHSECDSLPNYLGALLHKTNQLPFMVTAKFKCVVRVAAIVPWRAEDFCSPPGTYRMRLTLEDPTARIHAFVYAEDGENFFEGYPPVDVLKRKRNKLLGVAESDDGNEINDAPRNPPWVQCCIKSYYLVKGDVWGSRKYRIFGTKLVRFFMDTNNVSCGNVCGIHAMESVQTRIDEMFSEIKKPLEAQICHVHASVTPQQLHERNLGELDNGLVEYVRSTERHKLDDKAIKDGGQLWKSLFVNDCKKKFRVLSDLTCSVANYALVDVAEQWDEILSQMHGYYINRLEMASLGYDNWIHSSVVAMVTRQLNDNDKESGSKHYFEPAFADTIREIAGCSASKTIYDRLKRYCDPSITQRNFAKCEQVFIPVCNSKHWFLVVLNFHDKRIEILDSRQHSRGNRITPYEKKLANIFTIVLNDMWKHEMRIPIKDFEYVVPHVPGEQISNNCGMYVIKYMEGWDNGRLTETIDVDNMALYRVTTISNLILDPANEVKDAVLEKLGIKH